MARPLSRLTSGPKAPSTAVTTSDEMWGTAKRIFLTTLRARTESDRSAGVSVCQTADRESKH